MDPDETLNNLRTCVDERDADAPVDVDEVIEYFRALDEWLSKGGMPPRAWR